MIRRRGQAFTLHERQAILATFDACHNLTKTAEAHGISIGGVSKLVHGRKGGEDGPQAQAEPSAPPGPLQRALAAHPKAFPDTKRVEIPAMRGAPLQIPKAKEPEKAATTQPAPALTLIPQPVTPHHPIPPTQSESKTRATSWELVGSIAIASKAVLALMHDELQSEQPGGPDGRALNEFASILQKLHISYGITVEKARLLHNESTGIIAKVEDLSKLPEGVTLDVAIAFVRGTIHGKLPA